MRAFEKVVSDLRLVAAGNYPPHWDTGFGLCQNLDCYGIAARYLCTVFESWPEYSGNPSYPVPASPDALHGGLADGLDEDGFGGLDAAAYWAADCGLYTGTYGAARRRLAAHVADVLEREEL